MMRFAKPDDHGFIDWHFYILACKNDRFYVGSSGKVASRIGQHLKGEGAVYTRRHGVDHIVAIYRCISHLDALWWERYFAIRLASKRPSTFSADQIERLLDAWVDGKVRTIRGRKISDQPYDPSTDRPVVMPMIEISPEMAAMALRNQERPRVKYHKVRSTYIGPMNYLYIRK